MLEKNKMGRICLQMGRIPVPGWRVGLVVLFAILAVGGPAVAGDNTGDNVVVKSRTTVRVDRSSGRLVRTQVVLPREVPALEVLARQGSAPKAVPARQVVEREVVDQIVEEVAARHEVDPLLAKSVLAVESAYNQFATSPKGAMGYMQLMPGTAKQLGVTNAYDARQNIEGGVKFLRYLKSKFEDERLVLAAYNAGEAAVKKHGWIPPYPETIDYVYKVGKRYGEARTLEARKKETAKVPGSKPEEAPAPQPEPRIVQVVDAAGRIHLRLP